MTGPLRTVSGTAAVLASLRASLAGDGVTAPLPPAGPERDRTLAMLRPAEPVTEPDAAVVVATSGSTGRPRGVVLSRGALTSSAEATHRRLGGPGTWVLALPVHYIAGLMVLVRSVVAGRAALAVDGRLAGLSDLALPESEPCYLALVPTQLARALASPASAATLTRFAAVLVGGAAVDAALLNRAAAAGIRVVTTYGASETCGGCVYDGWPLDGVAVFADRDARLRITGPVLFSGYRLDPDATARSLIDGQLLTSDRGTVVDGRVRVLGRVDDVVISGGMNVDLAAVERALGAWLATREPGSEAAVVGVPHPVWGTEVVAVLGGQDHPLVSEGPRAHRPAAETGVRLSHPEAVGELRSALAADLPRYALPRRIVVRSALPRTAGGKIDRRRLIAEIGTRDDADTQSEGEPPP